MEALVLRGAAGEGARVRAMAWREARAASGKTKTEAAEHGPQDEGIDGKHNFWHANDAQMRVIAAAY